MVGGQHKVHIYRVLQCLSPLPNWDPSPPPPPPQAFVSPPELRGGGEVHARLPVRGWGGPNADGWRKSLALSLLCGGQHTPPPNTIPPSADWTWRPLT